MWKFDDSSNSDSMYDNNTRKETFTSELGLNSKMDDHNKKVEVFKAECSLFKLPFRQITRVYRSFWESLFDVISKKPHEQHTVRAGIIFSKVFFDNYLSKHIYELPYEIKHYYLENSDDGESVFRHIIKDSSLPRTIVFKSDMSISKLVSLTEEDLHIIIITRQDMEIRVFYQGTVSVLENREWMVYQRKEEIYERIKDTIETVSPFFERLLYFAYYELAIEKIGATLVYCMEKHNLSGVEAKEFDKYVNLDNPAELLLLKKYAMNHDGAIIINPDNTVAKISAKLSPDPDSINAMEEEHHFPGMRHTSSAAFSYDHPDTIIITTSDDGGATVFKNGQILLSTKYRTTDLKRNQAKPDVPVSKSNNSIHMIITPSVLPSKKEGLAHSPMRKRINRYMLEKHFESFKKIADRWGDFSEIEYATTRCPRCSQEYLIGYIRVSGWNDHEQLECEKCGTVYYEKSCFEIKGIPIDSLPSRDMTK